MDIQAIEKICSIIRSNKSFSIYTHINTDIDAIGSSLALKRALNSMGKTAHVFVDSVFPNNASMFEDVGKINNEKYSLYSGISYRHCLVINNGSLIGDLTPPHDITNKPIKDYLPTSEKGKELLNIMLF